MKTTIAAIATQLESDGYLPQQHPNENSYRNQRRLISIYAVGHNLAQWTVANLTLAQNGSGPVASGTIQARHPDAVELLDSNGAILISGDAFDVARKLSSIAAAIVD